MGIYDRGHGWRFSGGRAVRGVVIAVMAVIDGFLLRCCAVLYEGIQG